MGDSCNAPTDARIACLEAELGAVKDQIRSLAEQVPGIIAILCLPLPRASRLEITFRQMEDLPNDALGAIVKRYISESRMSGLGLDDMLIPVVNVLGSERARDIIDANHLRETYGDCAALRWEGMGGSHSRKGRTR